MCDVFCVGLSVRQETQYGETFLHLAAACAKQNIAAYVIETHQVDTAFINKQTTSGTTSLRGSSVDTSGWTALHIVCALGLCKFVQYLLDHGADKSLKTTAGETAVDIAKKHKQEKVLSLLGVKVPASSSRSRGVASTRPAAKPAKKASGQWNY